MFTLFLLLSLVISGYYCSNEKPVVKTPLGTISGSIKTSFNGRKFSAFEGIPYAKPPVGDRRFEEPEPVEPWHGTWEATLLTQCAQISMSQLNTTMGDEDCLHINVYVPRENPNPEEKLEVIVHVHGGAYMYGSGHGYSTPERPMDRDIIFITFNYRIGILGFLSTEDDVVPGNNGLKDQALALKWVKENIASFGGNPDSITLTGLSAGGSSVHLHYFSDYSKGLFHRGFSQSGLALNPWSIAEDPLKKAKKLANALKCPTDSTKILVDCLKQRPHRQILEKTQEFFVYKILPCVPFGPVVEKGGARPFLKKQPYELLRKGEVLDVPWITSVATHEGLFPVFAFNDFDYIDEHWNDLAPAFFDFVDTLPESEWKSAAEKIKEHYFGSDKISNENTVKLVEVFSHRIFFSDVDTAVLLQSKANKSPVYFFIFGYPGDNNEHKLVSHGAEIKYMFRTGILASGSELTPNEVQMKDALWDLIISYAETGNPTISGVKLEPTQPDKLTYLKINGYAPEDITVESTEELIDRKFWDSFHFAENKNLFTETKEEL